MPSDNCSSEFAACHSYIISCIAWEEVWQSQCTAGVTTLKGPVKEGVYQVSNTRLVTEGTGKAW